MEYLKGSNMKYGKEEVTRTIDKDGSTETVATNYVDGAPVQPIRRLYQMRHRVTFDEIFRKTEEFLLDSLRPGSKKLEVAFRVERTPINMKTNTYDLVECYTILEY